MKLELEPYILKTILERLMLTGKKENLHLVSLIQAMLAMKNFGNLVEASLPIIRFSDEARNKLIERGFPIFIPLTGQSVESLRQSGNPFWTKWHKDFPEIENLRSRICEVAFNPDKLFLEGSNNKTYQQQVNMVRKMSKELSRDVPEVRAIIGTAPDYTELAFNYLSLTGQYLFAKKHDFDYTRSVTKFGSDMVEVGNFGPALGLCLRGYWSPKSRLDYVWTAPLIIPRQALRK